MRRLALLCAAALGITIGISAPAHAGWPGGSVQHASDDSGYNAPFAFRCDNGYQGTLGIGASSKSFCGDVDAVYVAAGTQLQCRHSGNGSWQLFDATGWHSIGNFTVMVCYNQKD